MPQNADKAVVPFKPAVLGIPRGQRPWFGSRLVDQDWQWLKDASGRCRKFGTRESAQKACDQANAGARAQGGAP